MENNIEDVRSPENGVVSWRNAPGLRVLVWGLGVASYSGGWVMDLRMPHTFWGIVPPVLMLVICTTSLFRKDTGNTNAGCLLTFGMFIGFGVVYYFRLHSWTPLATGALFALYIWLHLKATGRSYPFMVAACLVSAGLSLRVPWPNAQRCLLTIVGIGIGAILQGVWLVIRYLQGYPSAKPPELPPDLPLFSKGSSNEKWGVRVVHWIIGSVGHVEVASTEFEQKICARYQFEIGQLKELGFDYRFTDGQTLSIFRLPLLLPAIAVIGLWCKRRPMSLHGRTRILIAYPICVSRDKTAFSEVGELGFSFHTAFQDGTILVSKGYKDDTSWGPSIIVNPCSDMAIGTAWADHQKRVHALESEGKRAEYDTTFQAWAGISHNETAPW